MEDADSLAFLTVSKAATKFIEPAPTGGNANPVYPPSWKPKFGFKKEAVGQYKALYSLLLAMNELQDLYTEGSIHPEDEIVAEEILDGLLAQFDRINKVLKFSQDDIQEFCDLCQIDVMLAIQELFRQDAGPSFGMSTKMMVKEGFGIGQCLVSLMDLVKIESVTVADLRPIILSLRGHYKSSRTYEKFSVVRHTIEKWINFCHGNNSSKVLTKDELDELKEDAVLLHSLKL